MKASKRKQSKPIRTQASIFSFHTGRIYIDGSPENPQICVSLREGVFSIYSNAGEAEDIREAASEENKLSIHGSRGVIYLKPNFGLVFRHYRGGISAYAAIGVHAKVVGKLFHVNPDWTIQLTSNRIKNKLFPTISIVGGRAPGPILNRRTDRDGEGINYASLADREDRPIESYRAPSAVDRYGIPPPNFFTGIDDEEASVSQSTSQLLARYREQVKRVLNPDD